MPSSPISDYLNTLRANLRAGDATEGRYYSALEDLVETLQPGINAFAHPKGRECGFPDFVVKRGDLAIGYIEGKDLGASLDQGEEDEQIRVRYRPTLDNLILTNYLEFRWYVGGQHRSTALRAEVVRHRMRGRRSSMKPAGGTAICYYCTGVRLPRGVIF
jgi:hypothetical protein